MQVQDKKYNISQILMKKITVTARNIFYGITPFIGSGDLKSYFSSVYSIDYGLDPTTLQIVNKDDGTSIQIHNLPW